MKVRIRRNSPRIARFEAVLKGRVVELCLVDAERLFIVGDEADAAELGEPKGAIYTMPEVRRIIPIEDPAVVADVHGWNWKDL